MKRRKIRAYDIASAYPYALALLPCFRHGRWKRFTSENLATQFTCAKETVSLIRFRVDAHPRSCPAWGPLPHRLPDGNITYPAVSAGGWAWSVEVRAARLLHPGVRPLEAWVWLPKCTHEPPFRARIVELFKRRISKEWGKTTRGIVLKLGLNSMYGKSAQRVGQGQFRCLVRAGIVTATTRAMLLSAVRCARDPWSVLELATDSVLSTEALTLPRPIRLGTENAAKKAGKAALGAWEGKDWKGGVFLLRPGLRFPIDANADEKSTAARGVGTRVLHQNRARVLAAWAKEPMAPVTVQQPAMFHGSKSSIRRVNGEPDVFGDVPYEYVRDELYGLWTDPEPRKIAYTPAPKRASLIVGPRHGKRPDIRLGLWEYPQTPDAVSCAYGKTPEGPLGEMLEELRTQDDEQPEAEALGVV